MMCFSYEKSRNLDGLQLDGVTWVLLYNVKRNNENIKLQTEWTKWEKRSHVVAQDADKDF